MKSKYPHCDRPLFGPTDSITGVEPYLGTVDHKVSNKKNTCKYYERFVFFFRIIKTPPKDKKKVCNDCLWFRRHAPLRKI